MPLRPPLTSAQIASATYVGSKEHKAVRWWGGLPGARLARDGKARRHRKLDTSICWMVSDSDQVTATQWVRQALQQDQFRYCEGDKTYPKHIWYKDPGGQHWFGFCINGVAGSYKGWPIDESEKRETFG
jgi:hypothetical protein